jgi:hypothetical protein
MYNRSDFRKGTAMKYRMPIVIVLSVFLVVLLRCGGPAYASGATVSGLNEAVQITSTGSSENIDSAEYITISSDRETATTSLRSTPIIISADLSRADEPVPDGTVVDFAISSGAGTLSGATTTVDGIATVKLTSSTVGTVIVSATVGSVSTTFRASFVAQPKQAIVKVATVGALASGTSIGGLHASVTYPAGVYSITPGGVSPSGVASGATTVFAANVETAGQVILALIDINGIQTGEFATLTFLVADGFLPNISDFSVTLAASDIAAAKNESIPGIGVVIQSLTLK